MPGDLALVLHHDEQAVLVAVELALALEDGVPSKTHILNQLYRLLDEKPCAASSAMPSVAPSTRGWRWLRCRRRSRRPSHRQAGVRRSDRGSQYAAEAYRKLLAAHGLVGSMGRRGNSDDNAKAESFMKTLKVEAIYPMAFESFEDAAAYLPGFIEVVYNRRRLIPVRPRGLTSQLNGP